MRFRPLLLACVVVLLDCASLDKLAPETCGNGVIDAAEDCDSFPNDPKDTTHARCGAATEGEAACHLRCGAQSSGDTLTCPDGWGCDVKGICREPSGEFTKFLGAVSGGATNLAVGDFDGDGRRDLVGSGPRNRSASRLRVHYFDDEGALVQVAALPAEAVSPVVFDHEHNGRDDIAFGLAATDSPGALGVVSGLADRTLLPVVFPAVSLQDTIAVPVFVFPSSTGIVLPNGSDNAILILERDPTAGPVLRSLEAELGGGGRLDRKLPAGPEELRGAPVAARMFDGNPMSTCDEIVVAAQTGGSGHVYVLSPCTSVKKPDGTTAARWDTSAAAFKSFDVPALKDTSRGVLVADIDGDGHLDVLVDTSEAPYILYGSADGTALAPPAKWQPKGIVVTAMPIAAGDLNLDGRVDFVFPNGAVLRTNDAGQGDAGADAGPAPGRDGTYAALPATEITVSLAAIGHFNGDALPDVVTASVGSPDLLLVSGGLSGSTVTTVTTDGVVQRIASGDFDGDHIDDVAIVQATSDPKSSDISIAYGRPFGGLEPPRRIGTVDTPNGIVVVPHGTAPADIGVYAQYREAPDKALRSTSFTLLAGAANRQPLAPLFFVEALSCTRIDDPCQPRRPALAPTAFRGWTPLGLGAGRLTSRDQSSVLAYAAGASTAVARDGFSFGVWVADGNRDVPGGLAAPKEQQVLDGQFDLYDVESRSGSLATATRDIDNRPDGLVEIIVATNAPSSADGILLVVHASEKGPPVAKTLSGLRVAPGAQLDAIDLDGDGFRDAIGFFTAGTESRLVAFLNDGTGSFVVPGITLNETAPGAESEGKAMAFAGIALRGAPVTGGRAKTNALAVLTERSVVLATLTSDRQGFDVKTVASLAAKGVTSATGIAAGDFNGDGLEDIAVADGSIRLMLQAPKKAKK
jgi:hypothetical protein